MISLQLYIDPLEKKARASLFSEQELLIPPLVHGETVKVSVSKVVRLENPTTQRIWKTPPIGDVQIKVAFGKSFQVPVAGTFTLTWGGDTTVELDYRPTAAEVAAALNNLASIITAGGVVVREPEDGAGNFFIIEFNDVGARLSIVGDPDNLAPLSVVDIGTLLPGSSTQAAVQSMRVVQSPGAFVVLTDELPDAACTPEQLQEGETGHNSRWLVELNPVPYGGRFTISIDNGTDPEEESDLISIFSTEEEIIAILEAMTCVGAGNVNVISQEDYSWIVNFRGDLAETDVQISNVAVDALKVPKGWMGELNLATAGIDLALAGNPTTIGLLEVRATPAGEGGQTWLQYEGPLNDGLIDPSSTTPTPQDGGLRIFTSATVSTTGNTNLANGYLQRSFQLICADGAAPYTRTITLLTSQAMDGDLMIILIELAASDDPTVEIHNATSGGTLLHTISGSVSGAQYQSVTLTYTGTTWLKMASAFLT